MPPKRTWLSFVAWILNLVSFLWLGFVIKFMFIDSAWPAYRYWYGEYFSNINLVWPLLDFWFPSCLKGQKMWMIYDFLGVYTIINTNGAGHFQIKRSFNYWDSLAMIKGYVNGSINSPVKLKRGGTEDILRTHETVRSKLLENSQTWVIRKFI